MNTSERIDELAASLYAAQRELKNPPKDATAKIPTKTGSFEFEYTSLPKLLDHIRPALDKVSLAIVQYVVGDGLHTLVTHSSGQWLLLGPYPLTPTTDPKQRGAEQTYARRYILAGLMRIAPGDEDLDSADIEPPARPTEASTQPSSAAGMVEAEGEGDADEQEATLREGSASSSPPKPSDKQRWMEEFHPGKAHKMAEAPNDKRWQICVTPTLGSAPCPWAIFQGKGDA